MDTRDGLHLLVDEMADIGAGLDVELDQQVEFAGGRIDFGGDLGVGELVRHFVGLAELALDLDEEGNHARLHMTESSKKPRAWQAFWRACGRVRYDAGGGTHGRRFT